MKTLEERRAYFREYARKNKEKLKESLRKAQKKYRLKNKEKVKKYQQEYDKTYRAKNLELIREKDRLRKPRKIAKAPPGYGRCSTCKAYKLLDDMVQNKNRANPNDEIYGYTNKCKECTSKKSKKLRKISREMAINKYGGKCTCCGEDTFELLTFDHINGGGHQHIKEIGRANLLRWIIKNKFPKIIQVLCYSCNYAKGRYGVCPHTLKKNYTPPK